MVVPPPRANTVLVRVFLDVIDHPHHGGWEEGSVHILRLAHGGDQTIHAPMVGLGKTPRLKQEQQHLVQLKHGLQVSPQSAALRPPPPVHARDAQVLLACAHWTHRIMIASQDRVDERRLLTLLQHELAKFVLIEQALLQAAQVSAAEGAALAMMRTMIIIVLGIDGHACGDPPRCARSIISTTFRGPPAAKSLLSFFRRRGGRLVWDGGRAGRA